MTFSLIYFSSDSYAFGVMSEKILFNLKSSPVHIFSKYFVVLAPMSSSVIRDDFCRWCGVESDFILLLVAVEFSKHCLLKRLFFLPFFLGYLIKNQVIITVRIYFWALDSIPLISVPGLSEAALCYYSFVLSFETGKCESPDLVLFQDYLGYLRSFAFLRRF